MRQATVIGITLATILVLGQVLMFNVGVRTDYARAAALSDEAYAPALQTTATATAASPAASPGSLPQTGAASNANLILLGAIALIVLGVSAVMLMTGQRKRQT